MIMKCWMYPRKNYNEIIQTHCMFKIICHKLNNKSAKYFLINPSFLKRALSLMKFIPPIFILTPLNLFFKFSIFLLKKGGERSNYKKNKRELFFAHENVYISNTPCLTFRFRSYSKGFLSLYTNIITEWLQISNLFHSSEIGNK